MFAVLQVLTLNKQLVLGIVFALCNQKPYQLCMVCKFVKVGIKESLEI